VTTIWEKIATCSGCTDEAPCSEHEAEALELYESEVKTPTWENLMQVAFSIALMSPDPSTQNSAFLVHPDKARSLVPETISVNEFPRNVRVTDERWVRPDKYLYVEHAERNALYNAARYGIATHGLIMVSPWASCADCARAIIQCGITTLVRFKMPPIQSWQMSTDIGDTMFAEAGVKVIEITDVGTVKPLRRNQRMWTPSNNPQ
jgi:dCMP deaminase